MIKRTLRGGSVAVAIASISFFVVAGLFGGTSAMAAEPLPGKATQSTIRTPDSGLNEVAPAFRNRIGWSASPGEGLRPSASPDGIGATDSPLGAFLAMVAAQAGIVRADLDQLYANLFIGSTDDFIVKYRPTVDLPSCRLTPCSR